MWRWHCFWLVVLLVGAAPRVAGQGDASCATPPVVAQATIADEPITTVTVRYLQRVMREAEAEGAGCLVVVLDTPGGFVDATRKINKDILASRIPVVVYVAPSGARAASAGTFITMASHVAAMAPGTHLGAAHPVQLGATQTDEESPIENKIVNDSVAEIRTLANLRGRNAAWAERAVRESVTATAEEALGEGVIEFIAADVPDLLRQIDGRAVDAAGGTVTLATADARVVEISMWWGERVLGVISSPTVAFLLLLLGFYGVLFELLSPGWGVGGTVGVVCLLLACFGLAVMPVNYAGLLLLLAGLGMFVAEGFVTSYGALTVGGAICVAFGGLMLVDAPIKELRVPVEVVLPVAAASALIAFFLVVSVVRAHRGRVTTGSEGMTAERAVAAEDFALRDGRYVGRVRTHGELWNAVSDGPVDRGQSLHVAGQAGLTLHVQRASAGVADERLAAE